MDTDRFSEDLAEAKAHFRGTRVDPQRASVLRATGRTESPAKPSMSASQVMKEHEQMAKLLKGLAQSL